MTACLTLIGTSKTRGEGGLRLGRSPNVDFSGFRVAVFKDPRGDKKAEEMRW